MLINKCGGLKGQLLLLAPGNARGIAVALIIVSRSVRATCFMRGNAPCDGVTRFWRVAFLYAKMPNVLSLAPFSRGVAPGYWQQLGFQPASIHIFLRRTHTPLLSTVVYIYIIVQSYAFARKEKRVGGEK